MSELGPELAREPQPAPRASAALLIDTENLFYDYGLWLSANRFGYLKHLCDPGVAEAVSVNVDRGAIRTAAERALRCCATWASQITERPLGVMNSYGKDADWGVRSIQNVVGDAGFSPINVPTGKNEAENALIADFQRLRSTHDTFVFGGEDHAVRTEVHKYLYGNDGRPNPKKRNEVVELKQIQTLRYAFIVPQTNFGGIGFHPTTGGLNAGKSALLVEPGRLQRALPDLLKGRDQKTRYYIALCEVVVVTDAARKTNLNLPAVRAPVVAEPPIGTPVDWAPAGEVNPARSAAESAADTTSVVWPARSAPRPKSGRYRDRLSVDELTSNNVWELVAIRLTAPCSLRRPATVSDIVSPNWRETLRVALTTPLDLSSLSEIAAERIHQTFTENSAAAEDLAVQNEAGHAESGTGWRHKLAAAVLLPELIAGVEGLQSDHRLLKLAYKRAQGWIDR